ncbi:MAG: NAD-dependent deacylase, partial [Candidatus Kapaibacterium sp.]
KEIISKVVDKLIEAKNISVLTGAGVSAESGIATFRDPEGLWAKFNPQELASIDGFMSNPERVWSWYQYRVKIVNEAKPNRGHFALAEFEKLNNNFNLITQNVDGLHQRAGSRNVIELHGSIIRNKCFSCNEIHYDLVIDKNQLNNCKYCNGLIRPDVVWFGEMLPEKEIESAQVCASSSDVFFSIGTSAEVYPAADLPIIAIRNGAFIIEINPNKTQLSDYVDLKISLPSGDVLPLIIEEYKKRKLIC